MRENDYDNILIEYKKIMETALITEFLDDLKKLESGKFFVIQIREKWEEKI